MAKVISAMGYMHLANDSELTQLTRDDVFDMLENIEDELLDVKEDAARILAKGSNYEAQRTVHRVNDALNSLNDLWELIRESTVTEFYMEDRCKDRINTAARATLACQYLSEDILYKCRVMYRSCDIELTEAGAKVTTKNQMEDEPTYISFTLTKGAEVYTHDTRWSYDSAVAEAERLNKTSRFFRCKACGNISCVPKEDDRWMRIHRLQPVRRCKQCIERRKHANLQS